MRSAGFILALLLSCAAALGQTQPSEAEQERVSELHRIEAEASALPALHTDSIQQVVKLGVKYDMLEAETSLQPSQRECRLTVPGLAGVVRFTLFGPRPSELGPGSFFDLLQMDLSDPAAGQVYTRVSSYVGRVSIVRDSELGDTFTSIQLLQDAPPQPGVPMDEPPVRLYVQKTHVEGKEPPIHIKLSAETFMLLRFEHAGEVDHYVRPIIRELKQEHALFAIPDRYAWAALGPARPADPKTMEMIAQLVKQLDSDQFQIRSKASEDLVGLGFPKLLALGSLDRDKLTAQQRTEIDAVLDESLPLPIDRLRELGSNLNFVLDVLYSDKPELRKAAIDRLAVLTGHVVDFDVAASGEKQESTITQLRGKLVPPTTLPAQ